MKTAGVLLSRTPTQNAMAVYAMYCEIHYQRFNKPEIVEPHTGRLYLT